MGHFTKRGCWVAALLGCMGVEGAYAYEELLHEQVTTAAIVRLLAEDDFHARIGIRREQRFGQIFGPTLPASHWIIYGSGREDRLLRPMNHFFDPINNVGLNRGNNPTSLRWATDGALNPVYSIPEAREAFYRSLVTVDPFVRERYFAQTFRAVGQFTHLLQDTAQPQHVRDDIHISLSENLSRALPGLFPRWSRYESFTRTLAPGTGYPTVKLPTFTSYWIGGGKGLAEFTNRNFVSEQTNFGQDGNRYTSPPLPDPASLREEIIAQVFDLNGNTPIPGATNIAVRYVANTAQDLYEPGQTAANDRLSAFSVLDFQHFTTTGRHVYSLYNTNHQAYFNILAPRAVGYSAGIMGYFFRGALEISEPDDVVYAMVDPTQNDSFTKIKLKVRNITPNESMTSGTLWAVAKFHRNTCYRSDLKGEQGAPGINILACRSAEEEIAVSLPETPPELASGGTAIPLTFNFQGSPIPVGATDLFLQVVYRGALGDEVDAVAVGTKDLFEPTHIAVANGTDIVVINDVFYTREEIVAGIVAGDSKFAKVDLNGDRSYGPGDAVISPSDFFDLAVSFRAPGVGVVANIPQLPNGRFVRMTVLTDRPVLNFFAGAAQFSPEGTVNQVTGFTFFVTAASLLRDFWVTNADIFVRCVLGTTCDPDLDNMPKSVVANATTPLPVTVNIP